MAAILDELVPLSCWKLHIYTWRNALESLQEQPLQNSDFSLGVTSRNTQYYRSAHTVGMWIMKTRLREGGKGKKGERRTELTCWESSGIRCARWTLRGYFHLPTPPAVFVSQSKLFFSRGKNKERERERGMCPENGNPREKKEKEKRVSAESKSLPPHQYI